MHQCLQSPIHCWAEEWLVVSFYTQRTVQPLEIQWVFMKFAESGASFFGLCAVLMLMALFREKREALILQAGVSIQYVCTFFIIWLVPQFVLATNQTNNKRVLFMIVNNKSWILWTHENPILLWRYWSNIYKNLSSFFFHVYLLRCWQQQLMAFPGIPRLIVLGRVTWCLLYKQVTDLF